MERKFRLGSRAVVMVPLDGREIVKFYGNPLEVPAADPEEVRLPCGMTERQLKLTQQLASRLSPDFLYDLRRDAARGQIRLLSLSTKL